MWYIYLDGDFTLSFSTLSLEIGLLFPGNALSYMIHNGINEIYVILKSDINTKGQVWSIFLQTWYWISYETLHLTDYNAHKQSTIYSDISLPKLYREVELYHKAVKRVADLKT